MWLVTEIAAVVTGELCAVKLWYLAGSSGGETQLAQLLGVLLGGIVALVAHTELHDTRGDIQRLF